MSAAKMERAVRRAFQTELNRSPTEEELEAALVVELSAAEHVQRIRRAFPEYRERQGFLAACGEEALVAREEALTAAFREIFGREPDADGWRHYLYQHAGTIEEIQAEMRKSPEARGVEVGVAAASYGAGDLTDVLRRIQRIEDRLGISDIWVSDDRIRCGKAHPPPTVDDWVARKLAHEKRLQGMVKTAAGRAFIDARARLPAAHEIKWLKQRNYKTKLQEADFFSRVTDRYGAGYHDGSRADGWGFDDEEHWDRLPRWQQIAKNILSAVVVATEGACPASTLDVGCGRGSLVACMIDRGLEAYGVDISDWAVRRPVEGAAGRLLRGLAVSLPFDAGSIELVTALDILEHHPAEYVDLAIREVCRVASRAVFVTVPEPTPATGARLLPDGEELHEHYVVQGADWWEDQFLEHGFARASLDAAPADEFPFNMGHDNVPLLFLAEYEA